MKIKRIIAGLLCVILTLMPMQTMAATEESLESSRQAALDVLDLAVETFFSNRSNFITPILKDMDTEYDQAKIKIQNSESTDEIEEISLDTAYVFMELGGMTVSVVPKGTSVAKVRKTYANRIKTMYKAYNKEDYTDYYWDAIEEAYSIGMRRMKRAKTYVEVARIYVEFCDAVEDQTTKDLFESDIIDQANLLQGYLEDEFRKKDYTAAEWKTITSTISKAQKKIQKAQDEEEIDMIMNDAAAVLEKYGKVKLDAYEKLFAFCQEDKDEALTDYVTNLDRSKYSESGYAKIWDIYMEAEDELYEAVSMKEIEKIYKKAIKKISKVKTAKQEVPGEKKNARNTLQKYLKNPKYNQKKAKPLVKKGIQAIKTCKTLDSIEKTLTKWQKKIEKTAYKFQIKSTAGTGGTITKSSKVVYGESMKFVMKADKGYKVAGVWVDGTYVGVRKSYTFRNVRKKHEIIVYFKKK
jgi:hypothetical protein